MSGLDLQQVSHSYGKLRAVDGVSLTMSPEEVFCLLGPSGCGKTTLLRLAAGLERLQAGRVLIAGRPVADERQALPPEQREVGMVFQDYALFPHLTLVANVEFGLWRCSPRERRTRALEWLGRVGMADRANSYPHTLSGGEQQRVALARALAPGPRVVLLDEPFAGLDKRLREQLRRDTLRILKESGAAVLMVTHDPEEAMAMADRIAIMHAGRIQQVGTPAEVYLRPANPFVARFLGETNRFEGVVSEGAVRTPLGPFPVDEYREGQPVEIVIRPEALRLGSAPNRAAIGGLAVVREARLIGANTVIHLTVDNHEDDGAASQLVVLQTGPCPLNRGDVVQIHVDPRQALVFARNGCV